MPEKRRTGETLPRTIDRFLPRPQIRERREITVRAPAALVFAAAQEFDLWSVPLIHAVFRLREKLLRATPPPRQPCGLIRETLRLGWGILAQIPGREIVMGAVTQPWRANVRFNALPADRFAGFAGPDLVKIAWTIEVKSLGPALTRLATETRAEPTDDMARRKFRRYWRLFGAGIVLIRMLALPAIRRRAERHYQQVRNES